MQTISESVTAESPGLRDNSQLIVPADGLLPEVITTSEFVDIV